MNKQEVILYFCTLATKVGDHFKNELAHDCFCKLSLNTNFQFDVKILDFIEKTIEEKIERVNK